MNFFILGKIQARERAGQLWAPYQRHQEDHPITRERNEGAQRPHELGTRKNIIELERNGGRENVLSEVCIYVCYHLFLFVCFSRWRTKCSWSSARRSAWGTSVSLRRRKWNGRMRSQRSGEIRMKIAPFWVYTEILSHEYSNNSLVWYEFLEFSISIGSEGAE